MTYGRRKPAEGGHGPVYTKNRIQFKQSTSQNFSSFSDLRICFLGSGVHFWGFSWQGMKAATQTEQKAFGKSENRSTSHRVHSIRELNFWKGVGEKREERKKKKTLKARICVGCLVGCDIMWNRSAKFLLKAAEGGNWRLEQRKSAGQQK